jgi:predicted  nucleic acid-binding Zn-ribbon protein
MDVEKTIQFLIEQAAAHDARLATIERAVLVLIEGQTQLQASLRETQESVKKTQESVAETQKAIRALSEKTDERFGAMASAIAKLVERIPNPVNGHA